ncbi:MAG: hypothetical protein ACI97A_000275 [Planctomycetota bacterium]|jgi:hypothetical protein
MGPPDPDVWILSVLEELNEPFTSDTAQFSKYSVFRLTGLLPVLKDRKKGSFVDERGVYHPGLIKRGRRSERIIADMQGPGVLTRIWLERQAGQLRIYADDAAEPVIDMACDAIFGNHIRFFTKPLCLRQGESAVLSLPIPFKKSLRVTLDGPSTNYEVQIRSYGEDVSLETFAPGRCVEAIYRAGRLFDSLKAKMVVPPSLTSKPGAALVIPRPDFSSSIPGHKSVVAFKKKVTTPTVVDSMTLDLLAPFKTLGDLEQLDLLVSCDDEVRIDLPLKHVFGVGSNFKVGITDAVQTYGAIPNRLNRWRFRVPIVFSKNITIHVRNRGVGRVDGLRLSFTSRAAAANEVHWQLCGVSAQGNTESKMLKLDVSGPGVLVRESIAGPYNDQIKGAMISCLDHGAELLKPATVVTHFAIPNSGNPQALGSSLWGKWGNPAVRGFLATRCRSLDRVPFTDLTWQLNGFKTTDLRDFSLGLMYYRPVEKTEALPDGQGR